MNALDRPVAALAHYLTQAERIADRWVHIVGLVAAIGGGALLVGLSIAEGGLGRASAVTIYIICLVATLAISAAYNLAQNYEMQQRLRRLDHAAIFLMIAGSYTPFTTQRLEGAWAIGMTIAVWAISLAAAAGKLFLPGVAKKYWVPVYLLLGWMVVGAIEPMIAGVQPTALILLLIGGVIYSLGVIVYVAGSLPFRRAIWHGFVVAAAGTHFAAILTGVVLA
jgi:hemolysin III